jgi:hypothetical protein
LIASSGRRSILVAAMGINVGNNVGVDINARLLAACIALACLGGCGSDRRPDEKFPIDPAPAVNGPAWLGFAGNAQHTAISGGAAQTLGRIVWQKFVDLEPPYTGDGLTIHYGSPVITDQNTVVLPIKVDARGAFRIEARSGGNGALIWSYDSDYQLPPFTWFPSYNLSLAAGAPDGSAPARLYAAGGGGKLLIRDAPDASDGTMQTAVFYGADTYAAAPAAFNATVKINTPITVDSQRNAFFGFQVTGSNPADLISGIARVGADGTGLWLAAIDAAGDPAIDKVATNSAPALSADEHTLYVVVNALDNARSDKPAYLVALDSQTLAVRASARLTDPATRAPAVVSDLSTASPTVGPDGDVYFGVLESTGHNNRGWMTHFDSTLATQKIPGSFGWDDTASIVPAAMVASYTGGSPYLLMTKYNNYGGVVGGDGANRVAILDPGAGQTDAYSSVTVMQEVATMLGPTTDPGVSGGVKEWCINSAAVDPATNSVLVNSEDGILYRWDLSTNQLSEQIRLTGGLGEAYTPTAVGADGSVYAISDATLFVVGP